jgi:uncharacterized membrane protein YqjE
MTQTNENAAPAAADQPFGELVKQLSEQTSALVHREVDLAKAELTEKGKQAGVGAGLFGAAGLVGVGAFFALTAALIALLAEGMDTWIAALIVAVVYGVIAAVAALQGRDRVKEATPPAPEQAIDSMKEDVRWAKTQARSGRT